MRVYRERNLAGRLPRSMDFFTKLTVLMGGIWVLLGSIFMGAFGVVFIVFFSISGGTESFADDGDWMPAAGQVEAIDVTGTKINKKRIYEYRFVYSANGKEYHGESYDYRRDSVDVGSPVKVEYKRDKPERARIAGMDEHMFPAFLAWIFLIPFLIGVAFLVIGVRSNSKALKLMLNGVATRGKLLGKRPTNTRINRRSVYAYEFEFLAKNEQPYIARCRTHLYDTVEDEEREIILYDPQHPQHNIVYDATPVAPEIDHHGDFVRAPAWRIVLFIAPLLATMAVMLAMILI